MKKIIFGLALLISINVGINTAHAELSPNEMLIVGTTKNLVKIYIGTMNIKKMRKRGLEELKIIDNAEFRQEYAQVFTYISDIPTYHKKHYGLSKSTTKLQIVKLVKTVTKKDLTNMVENVPDKMIIDLIHDYLNEEGIDYSNGLSLNVIQSAWSKLTAKINREVNKK